MTLLGLYLLTVVRVVALGLVANPDCSTITIRRVLMLLILIILGQISYGVHSYVS